MQPMAFALVVSAALQTMDNILFLDQSSYCTGYSIYQNGQLIEYGHFNCSGNNLGARLVQVKTKILELISIYQIKKVVFEDIQLQSDKNKKDDDGIQSIKTYKILAEVFGTLEETFTEYHIPYETIPPIVWKASVKIAGKGRKEEKRLAQKYVLEHYGYSVTEDEADAICIGAHYFIKQTIGFDWS